MITLGECPVIVAEIHFSTLYQGVQYSNFKTKETDYYPPYIWRKEILKKNCGHLIAHKNGKQTHYSAWIPTLFSFIIWMKGSQEPINNDIQKSFS